jgi:GxxExxY protein
MKENQFATLIVDAAYHMHREIGPGLLESVYERILAHELRNRGLEVARQVVVPIRYKGEDFDEGFRADLIVAGAVIVEVKSTEAQHPIHAKQLRTYLKLTGLRLGLVVNFGLGLIKDGITRVVNGLPEGRASLEQ